MSTKGSVQLDGPPCKVLARLLLEDVIPFVPDEVEGRVSPDGVQGDGRDDAAAVLLSDSRVRREGHVQVPWQNKHIFFNHNPEGKMYSFTTQYSNYRML